MAMSQTPVSTNLTTEISNTSEPVPTSVSSSSILTKLTSLRPEPSIASSTSILYMPSKLPSSFIPSSTSAIFSTIPNSATTTSETKSASSADQRTMTDGATTIVQTSTESTAVTSLQSTAALTSKEGTTLDSQLTPDSQVSTVQTTSLQARTSVLTTLSGKTTKPYMSSTPNSDITTSREPTSISVFQTISPEAILKTRTTASDHPDTMTTNGKTSPAEVATTERISTKPATVKVTQSTKNIIASTGVTTKPPKKTTKPPLLLKTTVDMKTTNVKGTESSSNGREPILSIPQWFAVFLGTFLTLFLIFLTNVYYKAKMVPDTTKPSIELIKNGKKNDRPKSWQESNVPLEFMSLHIELPKETKVEMKCAENLAFEGDQPDNPGTSFKNPSFEEVTLTKL